MSKRDKNWEGWGMLALLASSAFVIFLVWLSIKVASQIR